MEPADRAAALGRQVEARTRHHARASPTVLSATVLPPAFGPEMNSVWPGGDGDVVRDAAALGEQHQRMARVEQRDPRRLVEDRLGRDRVVRHDRGRGDHVEESRPPRATRGSPPPPRATQPENLTRIRRSSSTTSASASFSRLLSSTISSGSMNSVWPLCEVPCTMPLHEAFAVGADRQDVAILALRVVGVLQVRLNRSSPSSDVHPLLELDLSAAARGAAPERVARVIDELAVGVERIEDRVEHMAEVGESLGIRARAGRDGRVLAQVGAQLRERPAGRRDGDELGGVERRGLLDAIDRAGDLDDATERQREVARCERASFTDLRGRSRARHRSSRAIPHRARPPHRGASRSASPSGRPTSASPGRRASSARP